MELFVQVLVYNLKQHKVGSLEFTDFFYLTITQVTLYNLYNGEIKEVTKTCIKFMLSQSSKRR